MEQVNLERRIRRQVKGRVHQLAAICHPGITDLALNELKELHFNASEEAPGLLTFSVRIEDIYRVHLQSRLISSFRLRLMDFACRNREDLFRKLRSFTWEYWLSTGNFHIRLTRGGPFPRRQNQGKRP